VLLLLLLLRCALLLLCRGACSALDAQQLAVE
jgi:hypothetical protein